ncbi:MAG: phosphatidate cytidylyltransferase [Limisphaerales bacterium]
MNRLDHESIQLLYGVLAVLVIGSIAGFTARKRVTSERARATLAGINSRLLGWWGMIVVFLASTWLGQSSTYVLFGFSSFWALREFVTLTPTRLADHRALFLSFFVVIPIQYYLLALDWYGFYVVFIPVYAFLILPARSAVAGDCERFLERAAKIQWGLMICVYCLSYTPALLSLKIPGYEGQNPKLLFWFVLVVETNDVLQFLWGRTMGRHLIAPKVSPNRTWEGFVGGVVCAVLLGTALYGVTPFSPVEAAGMSLAITLMGFAGGLTMSAIKRDRGIKAFGTGLAGQGGVLDRIEAICFAAPIFFT